MSTHEAEYRSRGTWNEIKGKIKMAYADLTEDDLTYEEGQEDKWIGKLQQKLGKTEHEIKTWLGSL